MADPVVWPLLAAIIAGVILTVHCIRERMK